MGFSNKWFEYNLLTNLLTKNFYVRLSEFEIDVVLKQPLLIKLFRSFRALHSCLTYPLLYELIQYSVLVVKVLFSL